jgi:hypothetical protein
VYGNDLVVGRLREGMYRCVGYLLQKVRRGWRMYPSLAMSIVEQDRDCIRCYSRISAI